MQIRDSDVPGLSFELEWPKISDEIGCLLKTGGKVLIHCRGGLGRTGMIAAGLLTEFGLSPEQAINEVRRVREGSIETWEQEQYVRRLKSLSEEWRASTEYVVSTGAWISEADLLEKLREGASHPEILIADWLSRREIFSVNYECKRYFPLYAFKPGDFSMPVLRPILDAFNNRSDWGVSFWFASPCSYLGARLPQDVMAENFEAVILAARDCVVGVQHG